MKIIRPIEVETCCICKRQFDKIRMKDLHPGKTTIWMCIDCYNRGGSRADARKKGWRLHNQEGRK